MPRHCLESARDQALPPLLLQGVHRILNQKLVRTTTYHLTFLFFNFVFSKRECPLCKGAMRTHRELRPYGKIMELMSFIKPLIDKEREADEQMI